MKDTTTLRGEQSAADTPDTSTSFCLIVLGGDPPGRALLRRYAKSAALLIAADAGGRAFLNADIMPHVLVGDMDSLSRADAAALKGVHQVMLPTHKDMTDSCAALDLALERGFCDIVLLGALGGRLDHEMGNLMLLSRALDAGASACIVSEHQRVRLLSTGRNELRGFTGQTLSLIPWGGDALVARSEGLEYPLNPLLLTPAYPVGVSNVMTCERACVWIERGRVLAMFNEQSHPNR